MLYIAIELHLPFVDALAMTVKINFDTEDLTVVEFAFPSDESGSDASEAIPFLRSIANTAANARVLHCNIDARLNVFFTFTDFLFSKSI